MPFPHLSVLIRGFRSSAPRPHRLNRSRGAWALTASAVLLGAAALTAQNVNFADTFTPGPSPEWSNYSGNWTASSGSYFAQSPSLSPFAITALPFDLTDLTVSMTVSNLGDGGIWLHSDGTGQNGVLLDTGGDGCGSSQPGQYACTAMYWHVVQNGSISPELNAVTGVFTPGGTYKITVVVSGNTYAAYSNGTLITTLVNSTFPSGDVGLFGGGWAGAESFSDFKLTSSSSSGSVLTAALYGDVYQWLIEQPSGGGNPIFSLQYGANGGSPADTGFWFNSDGTMNFAPGQTFPGVATSAQLAAEVSRAEAAESGLNTAVGSEASRAEGAESTLQALVNRLDATKANLYGGNQFTGDQIVAGSAVSKQVAVPFSAAPTFDASQGNGFQIVLSGNVVSSTLINAVAGQVIVLEICQNASGGYRFTFPGNVKGAVAPNRAKSSCTPEPFYFDGTDAWYMR